MSEFVTANSGQRSWLYSSKVLWAAKTMSDCVSAKGWAMAEAPVSRWENNISGTWSWTLKDTNQRHRRIKVNLITRLATYEWSDNFKEGKMIVSNKEIQSICNIFAQCQTHLLKLNQFPNLFQLFAKMQKVLQKVSYFAYDIIINEIKLERQLSCCSPSFCGQKACWGQLLEVSMLLTTSENLFHQGREWPFIPIMQLFFNYLALYDAVGCIAACCSPLRVHNEFLCFYTWIDWLCRSKACLDTWNTTHIAL